MQIHKTLHFGLLLIILLFLGQCSEQNTSEATTRIFANFEVRYLAEDLQLRGQAFFSQGDSINNARPISFTNGVAFMGSGTKIKQLPGGILRYETTLETAYVSPARFSFNLPQQENITELSFPMNGIDNFELISASKANGLKISLDGGLAKDESLLLLFTDPQQETKTIIRPGPLTSKDLFIPADALLHFTPGAYRMFLVKSKEMMGVREGLEYQAIIEFYTKEKNFELVAE
jgi:hypothetical protein